MYIYIYIILQFGFLCLSIFHVSISLPHHHNQPEAFGIGVRRVLLVSGTGKRPKEDAIACLEQLATTGNYG